MDLILKTYASTKKMEYFFTLNRSELVMSLPFLRKNPVVINSNSLKRNTITSNKNAKIILFKYHDIISSPEFYVDTDHEKYYPVLKMRKPNFLYVSYDSHCALYSNRSHPNVSVSKYFVYNKNDYYKACLGLRSIIPTVDQIDTQAINIISSRIYQYASVYSRDGYITADISSINSNKKCFLCKSYNFKDHYLSNFLFNRKKFICNNCISESSIQFLDDGIFNDILTVFGIKHFDKDNNTIKMYLITDYIHKVLLKEILENLTRKSTNLFISNMPLSKYMEIKSCV